MQRRQAARTLVELVLDPPGQRKREAGLPFASMRIALLFMLASEVGGALYG
jgi:hypothetical protein